MVLLHVARHASKQMREVGKMAAAWQLLQSGQFLAQSPTMPGALMRCSLYDAAYMMQLM